MSSNAPPSESGLPEALKKIPFVNPQTVLKSLNLIGLIRPSEILLINCESESEAKLVNKIAKKFKKKVSIGFRLNPNVDAKTHKNISTGKAENKFGLSIKSFKTFFKTLSIYKNIKFIYSNINYTFVVVCIN